jgi:hypothetical protein
MTFLLQLLLAHFIGDFFLQSDKWIIDKEKHRWRSGYLYLHCIIHGILVLLVATSWQYWKQAAFIAATHCIIDGLKLQFQKESTKRAWFFADQALHLAVIGIVWKYTTGSMIPIAFLSNTKCLAILTGTLVLLHPASFFIKNFISKWIPSPVQKGSTEIINNAGQDTLEKAGRIIGMTERILIFIFILIQQWEAIGFLLAAKSVFRFGELNTARDRRLTEYVLIGTLISFFTAIATGLLVLQIMA